MTGKEYNSSDVEIFSESIVFDYVVPGEFLVFIYLHNSIWYRDAGLAYALELDEEEWMNHVLGLFKFSANLSMTKTHPQPGVDKML